MTFLKNQRNIFFDGCKDMSKNWLDHNYNSYRGVDLKPWSIILWINFEKYNNYVSITIFIGKFNVT